MVEGAFLGPPSLIGSIEKETKLQRKIKFELIEVICRIYIINIQAFSETHIVEEQTVSTSNSHILFTTYKPDSKAVCNTPNRHNHYDDSVISLVERSAI